MQDDFRDISLDWLMPGAEASSPAPDRKWTNEVAAAKLDAAREAAKSARAAAEAMQELENSGEDRRAAERSVLMAMRYLRQAYNALKSPL